MQMYMGEMDLNFGLYVAMNKNDCKIYTEIVPFDVECYEDHKRIASDIIRMGHINEFPRISTNPSWYSCKFCQAKEICHQGVKPARNCRTCEHSLLFQEGEWYCKFHEITLTETEQANGCDRFELGGAWI